MEAKDTVMSDEKILEIIADNYGAEDEPHPIPVGKIAKAQAEISFKAGQQDVCTVPVSKFIEQGRLEVVEFVEGQIPKTLANYVGFWQNWQAQKKKWGIKDAD